MTITLYRDDFRHHSGEDSFFNDVLDKLKIDKEDQEVIEEIELKVESFEIIE